MSEVTRSRRERLRVETAQEIKTIALALMADGGPDAISLRAIAREMGMTAGAIYGYYPTRDDLITALVRDVYASLVDTVEAARDAHPVTDPAARILAWGEAFRTWAVTNPQGFRLIYGDPINGYKAPPGGAAPEAERRACAGLTGLIADAWPHASPTLDNDHHEWSEFEPELAATVQESSPDLPPAAVAVALRLWGRMYGLVGLEIYGHLTTQTRDPAKLYRLELLDLVRSLGLDTE